MKKEKKKKELKEEKLTKAREGLVLSCISLLFFLSLSTIYFCGLRNNCYFKIYTHIHKYTEPDDDDDDIIIIINISALARAPLYNYTNTRSSKHTNKKNCMHTLFSIIYLYRYVCVGFL
jgi:hypothetical protein